MYANDHTQHRIRIVLFAMGIVILTVFSLQSLNIPVRDSVINTPTPSPNIEDWRGNSGHIPAASANPSAGM